jgi:hypothetical protein
MIIRTLMNNRVRIKVSNGFSEELTVESGVKQGDPPP